MGSFVSYARNLVAYLLFGVVALAATLLIALSLATVRSLYIGDMVTLPGYRVTGTAEVLGCKEVGPITTNGFGMWWKCDVVVELADGRAVQTTVGASIATPEDMGKAVRIVEFCRHPHHQECAYARPGSLALTLAAGIVQVLKIGVLVCGVGLSAIAFLVGLLGADLTSRLQRGRARGGGRRTSDEEQPIGTEEAVEKAAMETDVPPGFGELIINFEFHGAARAIYEKAAPTVRIDGTSPKIQPAWGECRILVAAGKRKCEVWVPFETLRLGYVSRKVAVAEGARVPLRYEAPRTPGASGSLEKI
ncbi:DUF6346 domain-containing protein [Plantactinospora sp. KLBMP9567]|uniref:DUF6346 domain-containing protein n=1 Tax=Plantactinospora sp. KLBMP9567 TaxID=3085900 RepID=UPI00298162A3|nr:DUF6346 domain-containing protein [Plantactinospora sp. KLBMP9567]MDW5326278.1 DUF6346 domain-containing protein [Plantactinospora sp. KLBMP9567]